MPEIKWHQQMYLGLHFPAYKLIRSKTEASPRVFSPMVHSAAFLFDAFCRVETEIWSGGI